MNFMTLTYI